MNEALLRLELSRIDEVASAIRVAAAELNVDPYQLRNNDGSFAMMPVLLARSNIYLAQALERNKK